MQYFKRTREIKLPKGDLLPQYNKQTDSLDKFKIKFNYESSLNKLKSMLKNFNIKIILVLLILLFIMLSAMLSIMFDAYNILMLYYEILFYQQCEFIELCYIVYHGLSLLNIYLIMYFMDNLKNNKLYYYVVFNIAYYVFLLSSNNFHELFSDNLENIKNLFQIGMIIYIVKLKYEQWLRG